MKIAVIQASSQKNKNALLYECVLKSVKDKKHEVINFGVYSNEEEIYSYIDIALNISLLLESRSIDFVVTGCSSGQGMMLACNSLPGIICGYIQNPTDAYLFGRINNGNVVSFPLGLNFGWAGEINLQIALDKLFDEPFGIGYPKEDALRKQADTRKLKEINTITKKGIIEILPCINSDLVKTSLKRDIIYNYIMDFGTNTKLIDLLKLYH